jgi:ectoine hydroxylase-related dioxygenase (phytanoyl-CoA dioxygenase family)
MEIPEFTLGSSFTDEQQTFFDTHGFIRFRGVASPEECDQLAMALDDLSDHWDSEGRDKVLGIPIQWGRKPDGKRYVQRYAYSSHYSPPIADFCTSERFEPVRRLCGDDARLAQTEKDGVVVNDFINDDGSNWKRLGWHTDGLRDLFYLTLPEPMLNVGLYLDDCPVQKGGVRLIPGTHTQGFWSMAFGKAYFLDHRPDPREVALTTRRGDLTIHDGRLWHRTEQAELKGPESRRRTMYMAFVDGPLRERTESSGTPFYHQLRGFVAGRSA